MTSYRRARFASAVTCIGLFLAFGGHELDIAVAQDTFGPQDVRLSRELIEAADPKGKPADMREKFREFFAAFRFNSNETIQEFLPIASSAMTEERRATLIDCLVFLLNEKPVASYTAIAREWLGNGEKLGFRFSVTPSFAVPGAHRTLVLKHDDKRWFAKTDQPQAADYRLFRVTSPKSHDSPSRDSKSHDSPSRDTAATSNPFELSEPEPFLADHLEQLIPRDTWQEVSIKRLDRQIRPASLYHDAQQTTDTLEADFTQPGWYVLEQTIAGLPMRSLIRAETFCVAAFHDRGSLLVATLDPITGNPVGGVDLELIRSAAAIGGEPKLLGKHRTDARGLWSGEAPSGLRVRATKGGESHPADVPEFDEVWDIKGMSRNATETRVLITTDRPLYRPGQTVQFKAVGRTAAQGKLTPVAPGPVRVEIRSPNFQLVHSAEYAWNEFGALSGSFELADEPTLGEYWLTVRVPMPVRKDEGLGDDSEPWRKDWTETFSVEAYRKPEFEVKVEAAETRNGAETGKGKSTRFRITANYFVGGPVADALVTWTADHEPAGITKASNWQQAPWDDPRRWFYEAHRRQEAWVDSWWQPREVLASGTGRTDAQGSLEVDVPIADDQVVRAFTVTATVQDASRLTAAGKADIKSLAPGVWKLEVGTDRLFYEPGEPIRAGLSLLDASGQPLAGRDVECAVMLADERLSSGETEFDILQSVRVKTDAAGRASLTTKAPKSGLLRVRVQLTDEQGRRIRKRVDVWVAGDAAVTMDNELLAPDFNSTLPSAIGVQSDRVAYAPGESARLLIRVPRAPITLLMSVQGRGFLRQESITMTERSQVVSLPILDTDPASLSVMFFGAHQGRLFAQGTYLLVDHEQRWLDVKLTTDKPRYQPREKSSVSIEVRDHAGQPVAAEVELAIVDESVLSLTDAKIADPRITFDPVYLEYSSLHVNLPYENDIGFLGWMTLGNARYVEGYDSDANGYYGGMGGGFGGGMGGLGGGGFFGGPAPGSRRPFVTSIIPVVGDGAPIVGPGAAAPQLAAAVTRRRMADTWHWDAHVRTDAQGRATVTLDAPDTLTRWRIVARAVSRADHSGLALSSVVTTKPAQVRLITPRFYTQGDEGTISTIVRSDLQAAAEFQVRLTADGAEGGGERRVMVPANGQVRVDWPLKVTKAGTLNLRAEARSATASDAIEWPLPVKRYGLPQAVSKSGVVEREWSSTLSLPEDADRDSVALTIHVDAPGASAIRAALPMLVQYPYGCVEQTMSRFLPAVAAAQAMRRAGLPQDELTGQLPNIVAAGLQRLYGFQHEDGGWGWWKDDATDNFMTAYVIFGLVTAREAGFVVDNAVIVNGLEYLVQLDSAESLMPLALWARRLAGHDLTQDLRVAGQIVRDRAAGVVRPRFGLTASLEEELAMLVLAGRKDLAAQLTKDLPKDVTPATVRQVSLAIRARLYVDSRDAQVPVLVDWLMKARRGAEWFSTLDTAYAVMALADLPDIGRTPVATVEVNGRPVERKRDARPGQAGQAAQPSEHWSVPSSHLQVGENRIVVRLRGEDAKPAYSSARLTWFGPPRATSPNGAPQAAASDTPLAVSWKWERGVRQDASVESPYAWRPLKPGETVTPRDLIRVSTVLASQAHVERLMLEAPLAAGTENITAREGELLEEVFGLGDRSWFAHEEDRDDRVCVAVGESNGKQAFSYVIRPTLPGRYRVLPPSVLAMYDPDHRAVGEPFLIHVVDAEK